MDRLRVVAWLLAGLTFIASSLTAYAAAPPPRLDTASAINLAGRERMLSQRMVKAYLMVGQGIAPKEGRTILDGSIKQFESQLATLKAFQPNPTARSAVAKLEEAWGPCKALLTAPPSEANANALYDANEALQNAAHSTLLAYEQLSTAPLDHLVGIAGRERMLSQRMAKFYLYRTWGLYDAPAHMELHLSRAHFTAILIQIEKSPQASAQVKAGVARLRSEWEPYQRVLLASQDPVEMRKNAPRAAELSERVLAAAEELVAQLLTEATTAAR